MEVKAGKKQNKLEIFEKTSGKCYKLGQKPEQHVQGEHKLKFWLKNIPKFQNCRSVKEKRPSFVTFTK